MTRAISRDTTHRLATIYSHHAKTKSTEREGAEETMEGYRNRIIMMLDCITDINMMRWIHDIVKLIMCNR